MAVLHAALAPGRRSLGKPDARSHWHAASGQGSPMPMSPSPIAQPMPPPPRSGSPGPMARPVRVDISEGNRPSSPLQMRRPLNCQRSPPSPRVGPQSILPWHHQVNPQSGIQVHVRMAVRILGPGIRVRARAFDEACTWAEHELGRSGSLRDPRSSFCWSSIKNSICSPGSAKNTGCPRDFVMPFALWSTTAHVHDRPWRTIHRISCASMPLVCAK